MNDKQKIIADTIADIIAEKRKRIEEMRRNLSAVPVRRDEQLAEIECIEVEVIRLEAAWKREKAECEAAATSKMLEGAIIIDNRGCGNTAAMCAATAGYRGAATAGYRGAATAGNYGAATSRGAVAVGENGVGTVRATRPKIKGGIGAMLTIAKESEDYYDIVAWKSFVIDGKKYKPDTWYTLKKGKVAEVKEGAGL